jgi:hypothetical protein
MFRKEFYPELLIYTCISNFKRVVPGGKPENPEIKKPHPFEVRSRITKKQIEILFDKNIVLYIKH